VGIYIAAGYGNEADTANITVKYNKVYNTAYENYAIALESSAGIDGVDFYGNVGDSTPSYGLMFGSGHGAAEKYIKNVHVYNNTFIHNAIGVLASGPTTDGSNLFNNNILSVSPGGRAWYMLDTNDSNYSPDYEILWGGPSDINALIHWVGNDYSLASFRAAKSKMMNSTNADPIVNADGTLQSTSPAINAGANLGIAYQMGLDPRSSFPWSTLSQNSYGSSWEIGAFVYLPQ
jgi:hypothetical protein